jgi:hypothetical protein
MQPDSSFEQSIKDFLTAESRKSPKTQFCEHCGSIMQHLFATFTFGDGESWDVPLPFCSSCERHRFPLS